MTRFAVVAVVVVLAGCLPRYRGDATAVSPAKVAIADARWARAAPTPAIRQRTESDCGQAALAMVMRRWGIAVGLDDLPRSPSRRGYRIAALRRLARARGLDAFVIRGTPADLAYEMRKGRPVIVGLVRPYTKGVVLNHFEVVVAVDPSTGDVVTIDPSTGDHLQRTAAALDREWKPAGRATLVVVGMAERER